MRKIITSVFVSTLILCVLGSCSGDTYAERLDDQKKLLDNFFAGKTIVDKYPSDGVFDENVYYHYKDTRLEVEIYFQVLDEGTGEKAREGSDGVSGTHVAVRYEKATTMGGDGTEYSNDIDLDPILFIYGESATYTDQYQPFLSQALTIPLLYVKNGAVVRMVIPFNGGSEWQKDNYKPFYYDKVTYTYQ